MMRAMRNLWNRKGSLAGAVVALCLVAPAGARAADSGFASSFWRPVGELPPTVAAHVPEYCGGAYLPLEFPYPLQTVPDEYPIRAQADGASYQVDGDVRLEGNVRIEQGNRIVTASEAVLDNRTRQATLNGTVRLLEPGVAAQGTRAGVNLDTRAATVEGVEFVLLDSALRGRASRLEQNPDGDLLVSAGFFTRCEPGNDNWHVGASSVTVASDDVFATARNAVLRVKGVPVFYAPYVRFPVTDARQSGWLFPNTSYSNRDGFDISLPYYLNLAPNYDAIISPRWVSDRGNGVEASFRHLSEWQRSSVRGAYLHRDDLYDGELSRSDFETLRDQGQIEGEFEPASRWLIGMNHIGSLGRFTTLVDYNAVSDRDYYRNLGNDLGVSSLITLERRAEVRYRDGGLGLRLWAQRFQRLDEGRIDPYQRMPSLDLTYDGDLGRVLQWSLASSFVNFDRDNAALTGVDAIVGHRLHLEPRVQLPLLASWGFLRFTGGYRYTQYDLSDQPPELESQPDRGIGFGTAHGGLFFERDVSAFGAALVQTLEPQLFYLYQQYEDQRLLPRFDATALTFGYSQLFRDNRFSGVDRIGDANQLSVGLTSRFVDSGTGREYLRASLGEIVYFRDRLVTVDGEVGSDQRQSTSALAGELSARVAEHWALSGTVIWNHQASDVDEGAAGLQYRRDNRHIVNFGYRWRLQDDIEQTDFSVYWPVSRHYAVVGRWNYDLGSGRTVEAFGGIEYNDCCWQIRLMGRRFVDSPTGRDLDTIDADDGIFLQIVFKGLAGFGTKVESVLERGIRGYRTESVDGF
jgi:LPS-assembly protein